MPIFVRKVNGAKWRDNALENKEPTADAITGCIRTTANTLSVWAIESKESINDAVLAMASAGDYLETFDIVLIPEEKLISLGLSYRSTPGITPIVDLVETHVDIEDLNYSGLGKVAQCITEAIVEERIFRYTRAKVVEVMNNAIQSGILDKGLIKSGWKLKDI